MFEDGIEGRLLSGSYLRINVEGRACPGFWQFLICSDMGPGFHWRRPIKDCSGAAVIYPTGVCLPPYLQHSLRCLRKKHLHCIFSGIHILLAFSRHSLLLDEPMTAQKGHCRSCFWVEITQSQWCPKQNFS